MTPMESPLPYDYASCVRASESVAWALDDVLPAGTPLDLRRPLLPASLLPLDERHELDAAAKLLLNQIVGNAYLSLLAFVEEYIVVMATRHAYGELFGDNNALRALLRLADEELKHQALFGRYRALLAPHLPHAAVLDNAVEVAGFVLDKSPLAVGLVTLHLELTTQHHYVSAARDDTAIDPSFSNLLKHHWLEEAQHARIDALEIARIVAVSDPESVAAALDDYVAICDALCTLLDRQAAMDVQTLGSMLPAAVPDPGGLSAHVAGAYRRMFIDAGQEHAVFIRTLARLTPDAPARGSAPLS